MKFPQFKKIKTKIKYDGTSQHLQKDMNLFKTVNKRIIILIVIIASITIGLIGKLYSIQIVDADYYAELVRRKEIAPVYSDSARGRILDRNGKVLTTNKAYNIITYHGKGKISDNKKFDLALEFVKVFNVEEELNERESKDLWLFRNKNGSTLVSRTEAKELKQDRTKIDELKRSRITDEMLETLTEQEKDAFVVYLQMQKQTAGNPALILEDVSDNEIAYLAEHQSTFEGFKWGTAWEREYVGPEGFENLIGKVKDIPAEKYSYMLSKGYSPNDKMGVSGLEYMYEDYLVGTKTKTKYDSNTGTYVVQSNGEKGSDLVLTIDMDLQAKVEKAVFSTFREYQGEKRRELMDGLDFVVSDPNTGEILAIVAVRKDSKGNLYNSPESVFFDAKAVGSVVKGATVYMGLEEKVVKPNEVIVDEPLHIKGTQPRVSYKPLGPMTDLTALQRSSNVYMFMVAIRLGGGKYIPNQPLLFSKPINETFSLMRNYYSQFGLGVNTMVDFPIELQGYKGSSQEGGLLLELAVGQYDNYNAMQLNQYMSTVANGGNRMKPYLVKEIINSDTNAVVYENTPTILNQLTGTSSLDRVREGFRRCVTVGSCGPKMKTRSYSAAAKTGTAQYIENGIPLMNNAYIAFAPFDNPKVATSCINSAAYKDTGSSLQNICRVLTPDVIDIYMYHK